MLFSLDALETNKSQVSNQIVFNLSEEIKDIDVIEPVEFIPVTELDQSGLIKYSLEEYLEKEMELTSSKPINSQAITNPEMDITVKVTSEEDIAFSDIQSIEATDLTIEETLKLRAEERKRKMKEFNYKFNLNSSKIDEIEKQPAYKRMGVDLDSPELNNNKSRMSLGKDSNDDTQLRFNNSFLHDNVD